MTPLPVQVAAGGDLLMGQYQAPEYGADATGDRAVLMCNPFGQEAIRCHRAFRQFAERLAKMGIASLRFDYFATGDSPGDDGDGDLQRWRRDIAAAHETLAQRSGAGRIAWVGLRLGASLALAASSLPDRRPDRVVLWDPVVDGSRYLEDLSHRHAVWTRLRDVDSEVLGFLLPRRLRTQIAAIDLLEALAGHEQPVAVLVGPQVQGREQLIARLPLLRPDAPHAVTTRATEWCSNEAMGTQWVPGEALDRLVEFVLDEPAARLSEGGHANARILKEYPQ